MYEAGFLKHRCAVLNRTEERDTAFGREGGDYRIAGYKWCNVSFTKGRRAIQEGSLDSLSVAVVRMRYNKLINADSRIEYEGAIYQQITPPIILKQEDEIQLNVQLIIQ